MSLTTEGGGIDVMAIVSLCHEIQDAAKRRETKSGGTIMCAEIASKILRLLEDRAPSQPVVGEAWRCVFDDPPRDDRECLVFCRKTTAMFVGRMGAGQFEYYDEAEEEWTPADLATHWRELPPPPSRDGG